jgi:hypothetical protein
MGWFDGTDGININFRNATDDPSFRINQASTSSHLITLSSGAYLSIANRSGASATQLYRDGVVEVIDSNANQASTALNNHTLLVGQSAAAVFVAAQFASVYAGGSMVGNLHTALAAADLAYMVAVGAA